MKRLGAAKGTGSGYRNLRSFPKDSSIHSQSRRGIKQPQLNAPTFRFVNTKPNRTSMLIYTQSHQLRRHGMLMEGHSEYKKKYNLIKSTLNYDDDVEKMSKSELAEKQIKLSGLMRYAIQTQDVNLLEVCYSIALKYKTKYGYAQMPRDGIPYEEIQNTDQSVGKVIEELREKKQ